MSAADIHCSVLPYVCWRMYLNVWSPPPQKKKITPLWKKSDKAKHPITSSSFDSRMKKRISSANYSIVHTNLTLVYKNIQRPIIRPEDWLNCLTVSEYLSPLCPLTLTLEINESPASRSSVHFKPTMWQEILKRCAGWFPRWPHLCCSGKCHGGHRASMRQREANLLGWGFPPHQWILIRSSDLVHSLHNSVWKAECRETTNFEEEGGGAGGSGGGARAQAWN